MAQPSASAAPVKLTIDGIDVTVDRSGRGPALLLIHGLGAGTQVWQRVVGPLSADFDVIAPHLPGFGYSKTPKQPFGVREHARFLAALLDRLEIPSAAAAGISYGGEIAAVLAASFQTRVTRLVEICPAGLQDFSIPRFFLRSGLVSGFLNVGLKNSRIIDRMSRVSFYDISRRPADICRIFSDQISSREKRDAFVYAMRDSLASGEMFRESLAGTKHPVLLLWGKEDRILSVRGAARFQQYRRDAQVRIFSQCGHSLPLECPGELCQEMRDFILK